MKRRVVAVLVALMAGFATYEWFSRPAPPEVDAPKTPIALRDGGSTQVLATLDEPIAKGKNAVWCASFEAAWKTLEDQVTRGPIALDGKPGLEDALNKAPDPRPDIPKESIYAAAGMAGQGIVEKIRREVPDKFPGKEPPSFPTGALDSFVAYAYLEANLKFSTPYFQSRKPLFFTDSTGRKAPIMSFGIRPEDVAGCQGLRRQPRVLFTRGDLHVEADNAGGALTKECEFAIDLSADSKPNQIVVARVSREPTLAATIAKVNAEIAQSEQAARSAPGASQDNRGIEINDDLLVPNLFWKLSHQFREIEGRRFAKPARILADISIAQQDILFRLDRSGAELKSETHMISVCAAPAHYVLDRPFLIYMCKRGSKTPYFAMWVDNADVLCQWPAGRLPKAAPALPEE